MIIVLDGPEKVGKTTLAQALVNAYPGKLVYRHWKTSWPDELEYRLADAFANGRHEVWDRTYISEMVYTELLGRPSFHPLFKPNMVAHLNSLFSNRNVHLWVLTGSTSRLRRLRDETDLPVDPEREQAMFAFLGGQLGAKLLETDQCTIEQNVKKILKGLQGE